MEASDGAKIVDTRLTVSSGTDRRCGITFVDGACLFRGPRLTGAPNTAMKDGPGFSCSSGDGPAGVEGKGVDMVTGPVSKITSGTSASSAKKLRGGGVVGADVSGCCGVAGGCRGSSDSGCA